MSKNWDSRVYDIVLYYIIEYLNLSLSINKSRVKIKQDDEVYITSHRPIPDPRGMDVEDEASVTAKKLIAIKYE